MIRIALAVLLLLALLAVALVHRKGQARDGKSSLYLYAYGSYGAAIPDFFASDRFSLVDRGITCAIAHIRGGGEMGKKFLGLGGWAPSDDGSQLAYSADETGYRQYDLQVKDLKTGATGPEKIARVDSFVWARDGKTIFYVTEDAVTKRSNQLWRHTLGSGKDDKIFEEKDEMFYLQVDRSRSVAGSLLMSNRSLRFMSWAAWSNECVYASVSAVRRALVKRWFMRSRRSLRPGRSWRWRTR